MTKEPKIIYLQIGDDADINDFEENDFETNAISWCWEKIFHTDIEYVSKSYLKFLIDDMIKDSGLYGELYAGGYEDALNELIKKIENK